MKTTTLSCLLFLLSMSAAFANPHEWSSRYDMGLSEYKIKTESDQKIKISCNTTAGNNFDHYVTFYDGQNIYQNTDSKFPLSFIFNGETHVTPLGTTTWRNGATAWNAFKNNIASAKKIEVFLNQQKVATFIPTPASILNIAQEIRGCEALWKSTNQYSQL